MLLNEIKEKENLKNSITKFAAVGGVAAFVGLCATSQSLATNEVAQQVGNISALIAGGSLFGALWKYASYEDRKNNKTILGEFVEMKNEVGALLNKFRKNEENVSIKMKKMN